MQLGRTDKELNTEILSDLLERGASKSMITKDYGLSVHQLNKIINGTSKEKEVLEKYREIQHLQLTGIQAKLLDGITDDKIQCASLTEIVGAFKALKDKELVMRGKATQITGIVGYLLELEKEEVNKDICIDEDFEVEDAEIIDCDLPRL